MQRKEYKTMPETPGVYLMKDTSGKLLYVGKAANLRRRVSSYFERPHDIRIETMVGQIAEIDFRQTDSALEALILEAELIKKLEPPYNVREKDGKSFLYVQITKDKFPRVILVRGKDIKEKDKAKRFGPFVSASNAREAMRILRRIFPWSTHPPEIIAEAEREKRVHPERSRRACFDYQIGLCPGTCIGAVSQAEYKKTIARLALFFAGKKHRVVTSLEKDMAAASKKLDFEKAAKLRGQIFALQHIQDTALISDTEVAKTESADTQKGEGNHSPIAHKPYRIEGYDISNISGTSAVGSMVVFEDGEPSKDEYRKFRIKTIEGPNDVGMLTEVLERRFKRHGNLSDASASSFPAVIARPSEAISPSVMPAKAGTRASSLSQWTMPDLILIDGGLPQVNAAYRVIRKLGLKIPLLGIAKGAERKRNDIIGAMPKAVDLATLIKVRDEAHRFAITYHKQLRRRRTFE